LKTGAGVRQRQKAVAIDGLSEILAFSPESPYGAPDTGSCLGEKDELSMYSSGAKNPVILCRRPANLGRGPAQTPGSGQLEKTGFRVKPGMTL